MKKISISLFLISIPFFAFAQSTNQNGAQVSASSVSQNTPQSASQTLSSADLQKQIQELVKIVQALQAQVAALQGELGATPATSTAPVPEVQTVTPDAVPPELTRSLSRGSSGDDVRKLQEFLAKDKDIYPDGLITGYFGPLTETAVKRWQEKHDIESVGVIGPKTLAKFQELGRGVVQGLIDQGAGQSGVMPPGLLTAPGIQSRAGISTTTAWRATSTYSIATSSAATISTSSAASSGAYSGSGSGYSPSASSTQTSSAAATTTASTSQASTTASTSTTPPASASRYPICGQAVKNVPGQYSSIQAAIDAANPGDTVRVTAGTYTENLTMKSGICLEGAGIDQTVITKSGASGIKVNNVSYVIMKNLTVKNSGCQPGPCGGGGEGGGVIVYYSNNILLDSCRLTGNSVVNGGGMRVYGTTNLTVSRCLIDNNRAGNVGGGVVLESNSTVLFNNVTVAGNSAGSWAGSYMNGSVGGLYSDSSVAMNNSIIWGNSTINGVGSNLGASGSGIRYSDISGWSGGTGNISLDPQFVSTTDYHLQSNSPAMNAGDPSTYDPDGSRADMGAYPFTGIVPSSSLSPGSTAPIATSTTSTSTSSQTVSSPSPTSTSSQSSTSTTAAATTTLSEAVPVLAPPTEIFIDKLSNGPGAEPPEVGYAVRFTYTISPGQSFNIYVKKPSDAAFVKYNQTNPYWSYSSNTLGIGEHKFYVTVVNTAGVEGSPTPTKSVSIYQSPTIASPASGATVSVPFQINLINGAPEVSGQHFAAYVFWPGGFWSTDSTDVSIPYGGPPLSPANNPHRVVVHSYDGNAPPGSRFANTVLNYFNVTTTSVTSAVQPHDLTSISTPGSVLSSLANILESLRSLILTLHTLQGLF